LALPSKVSKFTTLLRRVACYFRRQSGMPGAPIN
jgi:hypothetical protein